MPVTDGSSRLVFRIDGREASAFDGSRKRGDFEAGTCGRERFHDA
jgi:hypothetical protein